ncbi:hypothetical protein BDV37DRAFT_212285 [Aspergillus pseudonomiae]|uniref:Uncharacterized protein n=1 Tax=Aspergillus pseudonomiae TaxID=1506151 RepID=A0A5N7D166_9EURO|nr:uncharacterized protein BDV37DRAFT_212285 [Aspergillus pseudonomiae]KAE8400162.1 hypothetical protein BDV37DRAFT_212285 [Aspergillus pseudonomiae]
MLPVHLILAALLSPVVATGSVSQEQSNLLIHIPNLSRRTDGHPTTYTLDQSLLAIQIGGIVGAYVIFVAILLTLLLFVGRRLRRTVQSSNFSLQVEMMKPVKPPPSMDPSPVTPISANLPSPGMPNGFNRSWSSLGKGPRSHIANNSSVSTIDESVVALDRRRAQEEMEMLYAAVMEHDERRAAEKESEIHSPDSAQTNPFTDRSSRLSEAPPPPPPAKMPASPRASSRLSRISSLSLFNSKSHPEANTGKPRTPRTPRIPLRKLPISSPLGSPDVTASRSYGEDQPPLTPRFYNPPPPPTPPVVTIQGAGEKRVSKGSRAPAPAPLSMSVAGHGSSSLPFRDAYPQQSAPATKTTVLERPLKPMNGPRTGMPTPYSPYMPFTPVTPLTPSRMVTKRQRKREAKESGLRVLNEDDIVRDNDDMWGT